MSLEKLFPNTLDIYALYAMQKETNMSNLDQWGLISTLAFFRLCLT